MPDPSISRKRRGTRKGRARTLDDLNDAVADTLRDEYFQWFDALRSYVALCDDVDALSVWVRSLTPAASSGTIPSAPSDGDQQGDEVDAHRPTDRMTWDETLEAEDQAAIALLCKYPNLHSELPPGLTRDDLQTLLGRVITSGWQRVREIGEFYLEAMAGTPIVGFGAQWWRMYMPEKSTAIILTEQIYPEPDPVMTPVMGLDGYAIVVPIPDHYLATREELDAAFAEVRDLYLGFMKSLPDEKKPGRAIRPGPRTDYGRLVELYQTWQAAGRPDHLRGVIGRNPYDKRRLKQAKQWLAPNEEISLEQFMRGK